MENNFLLERPYSHKKNMCSWNTVISSSDINVYLFPCMTNVPVTSSPSKLSRSVRQWKLFLYETSYWRKQWVKQICAQQYNCFCILNIKKWVNRNRTMAMITALLDYQWLTLMFERKISFILSTYNRDKQVAIVRNITPLDFRMTSWTDNVRVRYFWWLFLVNNVVPSEVFKHDSLQHISAYIRRHRVLSLLKRSQMKSKLTCCVKLKTIWKIIILTTMTYPSYEWFDITGLFACHRWLNIDFLVIV